ncbi:MAG: DAK2 domain-containing protein [Eubacteriales bacterium]|nr:DAK2 domain-containing protein [Eubacteriales bacterium]
MEKIQTIDAIMFREMVNAGAKLLEENKDAVNALNVFPVPDGDTGTNMSMTMVSAVKEINSKEFSTIGQATQALSKGALRGARGNSGVILSQLYRGFSKAIQDKEEITPIDFANALKNSADTAYKAVMKPKEGTILTVARVIAEDAQAQVAKQPDDFLALFDVILDCGEKILAKTQEMLPALKQAGVVDAGGRGLLIIYAGYAAVLRGDIIDSSLVDMSKDVITESEFEEDYERIEDIEFAYSTKFDIQNMRADVSDIDIAALRRRINRIGNRANVEGDFTGVKVSVNTNDPGKALQYGCELGEINNVSITNLLIQFREAHGTEPDTPLKKYGIVSVSMGEGFSAIFKDLNVDSIVEGGQTMNPSIDDLSKAIEKIHAENIFILPNNSNITLAAKQAAEISDKNVIVLRTKNVAMGIAAVIAFQPDAEVEENTLSMTEAAERVRTGTITYAVRDSEYENMHITEGSTIGLNNGEVTVCTDNSRDAAMQLMEQIVTDDDSLITVYYGEGVDEEEAQALGREIADKYDGCDVEVHNGGQPLYYYLLSVE